MVDILVGKDGDIAISATGDISLTSSITQRILIRLRWIYGEWRLGPELGFPWFEEVFKKNPNIPKIRQLIRSEILKVDGVKSAEVTSVNYDKQKRTVSIHYTCTTSEEAYEEEVTLDG